MQPLKSVYPHIFEVMGYGFSTVGHVVPPGDAHIHAPPLRSVLSDPISEIAGCTSTPGGPYDLRSDIGDNSGLAGIRLGATRGGVG